MRSHKLLLLVLVVVVAAVTRLGGVHANRLSPGDSKPRLSIKGIQVGMHEDEVLRWVSQEYGLKAEPAPMAGFRLDGDLVFYVLDEDYRVGWVAGEKLEVNGVPVASFGLPASLGEPQIVTPEDMALALDAISGEWYPDLSLLVCKRESGPRVFSLGNPTGWKVPSSHGSSWADLQDQIG